MKSSRDKNEGTYRSGKEREKKMCEDNEWDEKKLKKKHIYICSLVHVGVGLYAARRAKKEAKRVFSSFLFLFQ